MGYSFSNIQIKNKGEALDTERMLELLTAGRNLRKAEAEEEVDIIIGIYPGKGNGWTTVVSDLFDQDDQALTNYARSLSEAFQTETLIIGCFDSDYLYMNLLDTGSDVDIWAACGHYPGEASRRSDFNAWKEYVTDAGAFREAMRKDRVFAEECLEEVEPILALPAKQSLQCVDSASERSGFACYRYVLSVNEKPDDLPRFELCSTRPIGFHFDQPNLIGFLNHGGPSKGVAVFIGGEPFDKHIAELERVELQLHRSNGQWLFIPVAMKKTEFDNGLKGFYGTCSAVRIPKAISESLPLRKRTDMEFDLSIRVRFTLRKTDFHYGPYGYIQVGLIPLANNAGQAVIVLPI